MKIAIYTITSIFLLVLNTITSAKDLYIEQTPLSESIERGAVVYNDFCIQCHLGKGEGVENTFPPLATSDWLTEDRFKEAIKVVKYGQQGSITVNNKEYNGVMANLELYDDEVADVMNYIMNSWGNTQKEMITEAIVKEIKP